MAKEISTATLIKTQNIRNIKRTILEMGSATKPEVAEKTGLSVVTCGTILNELSAQGEIVEESLRLSSGGRPAMSYRFSASAGSTLCLYAYTESNGSFIRYQILDILGNIKEVGVSQEKDINIHTLISHIQKILKPERNIKIIVIGIQGCINNNIVEFSDLANLTGVNVAHEISTVTGIPTRVENDMNTIALGVQKNFEKRKSLSAANSSKNIAILFFPKGQTPAGGFIVDGHVLRGSTNLAGELSFFPFGLNKELQRESFGNIKNAMSMVHQLIIATTVFLDPAVIVITGGLSSEMDQGTLLRILSNNLNRNQLPKIEIRPIVESEYFKGLHSIAVDFLLS